MDWAKAPEAAYDRRRGQPPIAPRVIASVILYGNLTRIRSSRKLEEALQVRLDFRWLVEGRSIDHTTISNFRRSNADALVPSAALIARGGKGDFNESFTMINYFNTPASHRQRLCRPAGPESHLIFRPLRWCRVFSQKWRFPTKGTIRSRTCGTC